MERLAQFRNKIVLVVFAAIFVLLYVETRVAGNGRLKVDMKDAALKQWRGILYYRDTAFTGQTFALYPTGDTAKLARYIDGKQDGLMLSKYPKKI